MINSKEQRELIRATRAFKWSENIYALSPDNNITEEELKRHAEAMHIEVLKRGNPFSLTIYDCFTHLYVRVAQTD